MDQVWKRLAGVLVLALLPYVVFFGETSRLVRNGVVEQRSINYAGIMLAAGGLWLAARIVFRRTLSERLDAPPTPAGFRALAGVLGLFCAYQVAVSAGF